MEAKARKALELAAAIKAKEVRQRAGLGWWGARQRANALALCYLGPYTLSAQASV